MDFKDTVLIISSSRHWHESHTNIHNMSNRLSEHRTSAQTAPSFGLHVHLPHVLWQNPPGHWAPNGLTIKASKHFPNLSCSAHSKRSGVGLSTQESCSIIFPSADTENRSVCIVNTPIMNQKVNWNPSGLSGCDGIAHFTLTHSCNLCFLYCTDSISRNAWEARDGSSISGSTAFIFRVH